MDQDRYDRGLKMRKQVLGAEYVDKALANVDDFNRDFQRLLTEYCWGEWADDTLKPRERSLLWLAYAQGWSHEEIAGAIGVKTGSLKQMLHRARHRLATLLERGGR